MKKFNVTKIEFDTFHSQMKQTYKYLFQSDKRKFELAAQSKSSREFILKNEKFLNYLKPSIEIIFAKTSQPHVFKNRYVKYKQIMMSTFSYTFKVKANILKNNYLV